MTRVKELLRENPIKSQLCNVTSDALTNIALFALKIHLSAKFFIIPLNEI